MNDAQKLTLIEALERGLASAIRPKLVVRDSGISQNVFLHTLWGGRNSIPFIRQPDATHVHEFKTLTEFCAQERDIRRSQATYTLETHFSINREALAALIEGVLNPAPEVKAPAPVEAAAPAPETPAAEVAPAPSEREQYLRRLGEPALIDMAREHGLNPAGGLYHNYEGLLAEILAFEKNYPAAEPVPAAPTTAEDSAPVADDRVAMEAKYHCMPMEQLRELARAKGIKATSRSKIADALLAA